MFHVSLWLLLFLSSSLRAAPADILVRAKTIVTMDAARRVIEDGAIAIAGSRILAIGPRAEIEAAYEAERAFDYPEGILIPGLLNGHTHAPMSLFRGLADDRTLEDWLQNFIFPAEARNVTPQFVYWGTRLAAAECCFPAPLFVDMYYFEEEVAGPPPMPDSRGRGPDGDQFPRPMPRLRERACAPRRS